MTSHYGPSDEDDFVVQVIHQPRRGGAYDCWHLQYASGHVEITTDADRVQKIIEDNHNGNRRTLR